MKLILYAIVSFFVIILLLKKIKNIILNLKLHKKHKFNEDKLEGYLTHIAFKINSSIEAQALAMMTHKQIVSSILFDAHCNNYFKEMLDIIENSEYQQANIINTLMSYYEKLIVNQEKTEEELRLIKKMVVILPKREWNKLLKI